LIVTRALRRKSALPAGLPDRGPEEERIATLAKALAHPARIHIVRLLLEKQSCIGCDIVEEVGLAQSTVSEHLRCLKAAGVITGEIERPRVCYSLNSEAMAPLAGLLNAILDRGVAGTLAGSIGRPSRDNC
jgi:ArsR family transcriptional regulator